MKIVYTYLARQDLRDICQSVANGLLVPSTAQKITEAIIASVRTLENTPERNPLYHDEPWRSKGLRFLPVNNFLVFYTVSAEAETVSVIRVMYGRRNISKQLMERDEI